MSQIPWFVRFRSLFEDEMRDVLAAFPGMAMSQGMLAQGQIVITGPISFARGKEMLSYAVRLTYPTEFPYSAPEITPVEDGDSISPATALARFLSARHQMANGALCLFERSSATGRHRHISGKDALLRAEVWLRAVSRGELPAGLDSAEADLQAHYEDAGDILLPPSLFNDSLPPSGEMTIRPRKTVGPHPLYIIDEIKDTNALDSDRDLYTTLHINRDKDDDGDGEFLQWYSLKSEPAPLRSLEELCRVLYPNEKDPVEKFRTEHSRERLTNKDLFVGLRYPGRNASGWEWLFLITAIRSDSMPRALGPAGEGLVLDFGAATDAWRTSRLRALRAQDLRRRKLLLRNGTGVPATAEKWTIAMFGLGALGSVCADLLAKSGVGSFLLCDHDRLEVGNVVRHIGRMQHVGIPKAHIVFDYILAHNPYCSVKGLPAPAKFVFEDPSNLEGTTAIVSTIADDLTELAINLQAVDTQKTVYYLRALRAGTAARLVRVRPGRDACLACHARYLQEEHPEAVSIEASEDEVLTRECGQAVLAASAADLTFTAALAVRTILLDLDSPGDESQWIWTVTGVPNSSGLASPLSLRKSALPPHPACEVCRQPPITEVRLPGEIEAFMLSETSKHSPDETGGVLVGFRQGSVVTVVAASDQGPNAKSSPVLFERDGPHCQAFLEQMVKRDARKVDYVGEWHSHPSSSPTPSSRDLASLSDIAADDQVLTSCPVMLIVGAAKSDKKRMEIRATAHPVQSSCAPIRLSIEEAHSEVQ